MMSFSDTHLMLIYYDDVFLSEVSMDSLTGYSGLAFSGSCAPQKLKTPVRIRSNSSTNMKSNAKYIIY